MCLPLSLFPSNKVLVLHLVIHLILILLRKSFLPRLRTLPLLLCLTEYVQFRVVLLLSV